MTDCHVDMKSIDTYIYKVISEATAISKEMHTEMHTAINAGASQHFFKERMVDAGLKMQQLVVSEAVTPCSNITATMDVGDRALMCQKIQHAGVLRLRVLHIYQAISGEFMWTTAPGAAQNKLSTIKLAYGQA